MIQIWMDLKIDTNFFRCLLSVIRLAVDSLDGPRAIRDILLTAGHDNILSVTNTTQILVMLQNGIIFFHVSIYLGPSRRCEFSYAYKSTSVHRRGISGGS